MAFDDVGLADVLSILAEISENEAESLDYTRKAGDQGVSRGDVAAWKKMAKTLDKLSRTASGLME
jgi:hypothetical protein